MERLTMNHGICKMVNTEYCRSHRDCHECNHGLEVFHRLAEYEGTGLTPEQVAALKERQMWIPVSERMPDKEQWCHIAVKTERGYRVEQDLFAVETADHFGHKHGFCKRKLYDIVYWMAFPDVPEPPKEAQEDGRT